MSIDTRVVLDELQALNTIASYGSLPPLLNISEVDSSPDFIAIRNVLNEMVEQVCLIGMPCNKDTDYDLDPDVNGEVLIPDGALTVLPENQYMHYIIERNGKLYNNRDKTFTLDTTIPCEIYWLQTFESLPLTVRKYVTISAGRRWVSRYKTDEATLSLTADDFRRAESEFLRYTEANNNTNMLYDNYEMSYITDRSANSYRRY
jgi:hypothetical protein